MRSEYKIGQHEYKFIYDSIREFNEKILKVDLNTVEEEAYEFPEYCFRIGAELAELDAHVATIKFELEVLEAELKDFMKDTSAAGGLKSPTVDALNSYVVQAPQYKTKKLKLIELEELRDKVNSFYWAMKAKFEKLLKVSPNLP